MGALVCAAAIVAAFAAPAGASEDAPRRLTGAPSLESAVIAEVNALRRRRGLRPLRMARGLAVAATRHNHAMAHRGIFAHELPGGPRFGARLRRHYRPEGRGWSVAENLAVAWPPPTAAETVRMWMASPLHRRNLLVPRWREIGVAALNVPNAPGDFGDADITLVTADFGVRK
jgi:uncharacterized protein YkwD